MATRRKKKATKKKATTRRPNPLTAQVGVSKIMEVEAGNVYEVTLQGKTKAHASLGHVTASNQTAAKKKAVLLIKRAL